jgi:two-component system sensor histidine kinase KdpD
VADRGVGVDDFERMMIFDKFYRGQGQRYRVQGTGMGLAIAKAIVEAHGGTIEVTSQPKQGSVFTFCLPCQESSIEHLSSGVVS